MKHLITILLIAFTCSSCVLAPIYQSVESAGAFKGDREKLLYQDLKKFHDARFWSNISTIPSFIHPDASPTLAKALAPKKKEERITESEVEDVKFEKDSYEADAVVIVKGYKLSTYVIEERREHQVWKFSLSSGWKILSIHNAAE